MYLGGFPEARRLCPDQLHPVSQSMFLKATSKLRCGKGKVLGEGSGYCHQTCSALLVCSRSLLFRWAGVRRSLSSGAQRGPTDGGTNSGLPPILCLTLVACVPLPPLKSQRRAPLSFSTHSVPHQQTQCHCDNCMYQTNTIWLSALSLSYWTETALWAGPDLVDYSGPKQGLQIKSRMPS